MTTLQKLPDAVIRQLPPKKLAEGFDVEYKLKYSGTTETDKRTMSFVDNLWGIEVTGGADQFEPLTIIAVRRVGLARRAGIRVGDYIVKINDTPAENLTLLEAQTEIQESGRHLRLFVKGEDPDSEDENVCDFYFKPLSQRELDLLEWERRRKKKREQNMLVYQGFPWNDRKRPIYKESNCYLVPSTVQIRHEREIKLKATKEEYLKNLRDMAEQKAEEERRRKREEEDSSEREFEALAKETKATQQTTEEFGKIIE